MEETILSIVWKKEDIASTMKDAGLDADDEAVRLFLEMNPTLLRRVEEGSIALGWEMIHNEIESLIKRQKINN